MYSIYRMEKLENYDEYKKMKNSKYSNNDIKLYFLIKYGYMININEFDERLKREEQDKFRNDLLERFNNKCILTGTSTVQACHIIPYSETKDMSIENGLLMNSHHHNIFDSYDLSINPKTLCIEISNKYKDDIFTTNCLRRIDILEQYVKVVENLSYHYDKFLKKNENNII